MTNSRSKEIRIVRLCARNDRALIYIFKTVEMEELIMSKVAVVYWSMTGNAIAFGCPAMGDEVLEESEFDPMFTACESKLSGKKIALFGSYDWGDGEWMRLWEERCQKAGANLACDFVICQLEPDDEANGACEKLGAALA